jgi:uncharacterized protein
MLAPLLAVALAGIPVQPAIPAAITVTGIAEVKFAPNQVITHFTVSNEGKDQNGTRKASDEKVRKVLEAVQKAGVDPRRVMTSDAGLGPNYRSNEVIGWMASRTITLYITDMKRVEEAISAAIGAGATPVTTVTLQNTEQRKYEEDARLGAAKAARSRAAAMIDALGAKLGPPRVVSESPAALQGSSATLNTANGVVIGSVSNELSVTSMVTVQFDIEG